MPDLQYWVETAFSRPAEIGALLVGVGVVALAAVLYPDRKDHVAAAFVVLAIAPALSIAGLGFPGEWHYWLVACAVGILLIVAVDFGRR
ncbi:MAG: hypothetical protein ABEJ68_01275 [Halobacteriaceae archaeon]